MNVYPLHPSISYKLKPDDFEWIEEERAKAAAARARIDARIAAAQDGGETVDAGAP